MTSTSLRVPLNGEAHRPRLAKSLVQILPPSWRRSRDSAWPSSSAPGGHPLPLRYRSSAGSYRTPPPRPLQTALPSSSPRVRVIDRLDRMDRVLATGTARNCSKDNLWAKHICILEYNPP